MHTVVYLIISTDPAHNPSCGGWDIVCESSLSQLINGFNWRGECHCVAGWSWRDGWIVFSLISLMESMRPHEFCSSWCEQGIMILSLTPLQLDILSLSYSELVYFADKSCVWHGGCSVGRLINLPINVQCSPLLLG
ncbi:hypothetical protein YC2023_090936 [Brassica napus]